VNTTMAPASHSEIAEAVNELADQYRDRCLWFLRPDYYPASDTERLRVLDYIARHGDLAAYRRAGRLKQWLLLSTSAPSAA